MASLIGGVAIVFANPRSSHEPVASADVVHAS
jgi:hypothetical protein